MSYSDPTTTEDLMLNFDAIHGMLVMFHLESGVLAPIDFEIEDSWDWSDGPPPLPWTLGPFSPKGEPTAPNLTLTIDPMGSAVTHEIPWLIGETPSPIPGAKVQTIRLSCDVTADVVALVP